TDYSVYLCSLCRENHRTDVGYPNTKALIRRCLKCKNNVSRQGAFGVRVASRREAVPVRRAASRREG
ncbi:hypothetical protein VB695_09690, partial [Nodularia spumigena UHCC 0060]|nr:hypothetical protein [Nodularia spumigena UHCC 0060]